MGVLAGFGDDDLIARHQVDRSWGVQMVAKEHPKEDPPGENRGKKALDRAIATAFAGPAREPYHRHSPCHSRHRHDDTAQPADRGGSHVRTSTLQQCYNIAHRGAPLSWMSC